VTLEGTAIIGPFVVLGIVRGAAGRATDPGPLQYGAQGGLRRQGGLRVPDLLVVRRQDAMGEVLHPTVRALVHGDLGIVDVDPMELLAVPAVRHARPGRGVPIGQPELAHGFPRNTAVGQGLADKVQFGCTELGAHL
jgi:hypothetical protein